jgi:HEAT repeat protein
VGAIARAVAAIHSQGGMAELKKWLRESTDSRVREATIEALGGVPTPEAGDVLVAEGLEGSKNGDTKYNAVNSLQVGRHYSQKAVDAVGKLLKSESSALRSAACIYFANWKQRESIPYLRAFLKDPDPNNRGVACEAIGLFMSEDPVPDLLELLADSNEVVRKSAKDVLERIRFYNEEKRRWQDWKARGGESQAEGIAKLFAMLDDKDSAVRLAAIDSLGSMKAKEALPRLVERLKAASPGPERDALQKSISKINE